MSSLIKLMTTTLFAIFAAVAVQAASLDPYGPYTSAGTCKTGDVSGGATQCFGAVVIGKGQSTNAAQVDVNNGTFGGTQGLFGITNWIDIFASSTSGATFGSNQGTFTVNWDLTGSVAVMLKMGNTWAAYLYNGLSAGTYNYDLTGMGKNALSNFRIVSTNPIPLPASASLLGLAVFGLYFASRRRKSV